MKVYELIVLAGAIVVAGCGGPKKTSTADSAATLSSSATANGATTSAAGATAADESPAPITGQIVEVKMIQDAQNNYRFDPADITIKAGDGVKFVMISGGPHNVAFDPAQLPASAKSQLSANMQGQVSELASPLM